jgi:uncharacterized protein YbaP (TraB family)
MLKLLVTVLLIACASQLQAQNKPHTVLWQVHKPGTRHTSYLFGTFHEVNGTYFSSLIASAKQLTRAELLFVERRNDEDKQAAAMRQKVLTWNATKWQSQLTNQQRVIFNRFVEKAEDSSYYRLPPLVLQLALARLYIQNFCDTLDRKSGELMDEYIEKMALSQQTPVKSLDTIDEVETALMPASNSTPESSHVANSIDLMNKMLQGDGSQCGFVQEYKAFDLDYAFERDISATNTLGVLERNAKWMSILDKAFRERNCFVAVGLRHLMYKQGLIQQLRRRGYTVTPVAAR